MKRSLVRQKDFSLLREQGRKMASSRWLVVIYNPNQVGYLRYAFSISRKVGSAVLRNKLRRWGRELIRKQVREGKDWAVDVHFIFRPMPDSFYSKLSLAEFSDLVKWERVRVQTDSQS